MDGYRCGVMGDGQAETSEMASWPGDASEQLAGTGAFRSGGFSINAPITSGDRDKPSIGDDMGPHTSLMGNDVVVRIGDDMDSPSSLIGNDAVVHIGNDKDSPSSLIGNVHVGDDIGPDKLSFGVGI